MIRPDGERQLRDFTATASPPTVTDVQSGKLRTIIADKPVKTIIYNPWAP